MSAVKSQLVSLIDYLPEQEQQLLFEIVRRFIPDDVATAEDLADIEEADENFARGDYVSHDDIDWN